MRSTTIVTVTLNPTIDKSCEVDRVSSEVKLRCSAPRLEPGGGGLNVSRAIRNLGGTSTAIWTKGDATGDLLHSLLDEDGISHRPVAIPGLTRENLIVYEQASGEQYRFGMPGPELSVADLDAAVAAIDGLREGVEWLVLSGSLPPGAPDDVYARMIRCAKDGARVVVDTSGGALQRTLDARPFLVKPNLRELSQLAGHPLESDEQIEEAAQGLVREGKVAVVVVSLGAGGAVVVSEEGARTVRAPTVPIRSKVGAGDSTVAGITLALSRGESLVDAARFGVAAGAAAVMTEGTELCRREDTERLYGCMKRRGY